MDRGKTFAAALGGQIAGLLPDAARGLFGAPPGGNSITDAAAIMNVPLSDEERAMGWQAAMAARNAAAAHKRRQEEAYRTNYAGPILTQGAPSDTPIGDWLGDKLMGLGLSPTESGNWGQKAEQATEMFGPGYAAAKQANGGDIGGALQNLVGGPSQAMFLGPMAKTADKAMLKAAEEMATKGAGRDDILKATGWFQGPDKKWRFEIDDGLSQFQGLNPEPQSTPLRASLKHPKLYEAYPDLIPLTVHEETLGQQGAKGLYRATPGNEQVAINWSAPPADKHSTLLHELQHAVQVREEFARGANPAEYASGAMFHERARSLQGALSKELTGSLTHKPDEIIRDIKYADPARVDAIVKEHGFQSVDEAVSFLKQQDEMRTPMSQYKRTAGEVEARNTQKRHMMSDMQRRESPPWDTQDVPDEQQIVRHREAYAKALAR